MNTEEVIKLIINKAYEVRSHFVAGYLESVYKKALLIELRDAGLKVEDEVEMPVRYKGHIIGDFRAGTSSELCHWLHFFRSMRNADGQTGAVFLLVKSGWARCPA